MEMPCAILNVGKGRIPVKRKYLFLCLLIALVLLILALLTIPRVHSVETVDSAQISNYPALEWAYADLCAEYSLYEIVPANNIQIVTVRNLWGTWQRYILPCFAANTPDIPRAGNADFTAFTYILSPWEQENFFTKLCPLKLNTFGVSMTPGENVMAYQLAEIVPNVSFSPEDLHVNATEFNLSIKHNCDKEPGLFVYYTMATLNSAQERDQSVTTEFSWSYRLSMVGYQFDEGTFTLSKAHTVNA